MVPCSGARARWSLPGRRCRRRSRAGLARRGRRARRPRRSCRARAPPAGRPRRSWRRRGAAPRAAAKCRPGASAAAASARPAMCSSTIAGVDVGLAVRQAPGEGAQEAEVAGHARQPELAQRAMRLGGGAGQVAGMHDQLGQQRIEAGAGAVAAYPKPSTRTPGPDGGSNAAITPPAGRAWPSALIVSRLTRACMRDAARAGTAACAARPSAASVAPAAISNCRRDQVDAGHLLGHRVLHLEARIGLDEGEAARRPRWH